MTEIKKIKDNIEAELKEFNEIFNSAFSTQDILLKEILDHIKLQKGKQIRPVLVIYFAKLLEGLNNNTLLGAAAIEMLHTASLVHDDVVDESMKRRNLPSANALFDNKKAVLAGDYLLTKAMKFMAETRDLDMINCLTDIAKDITRGEMLQLQHSYTLLSEEDYIEIIKNKTGILFSICASVAAIAAKAPKEKGKSIKEFATNLGICFQIRDDIFDYTKNAEIGKPIFNDIREGKITLPLLYTLKSMPTEEKDHIMSCISNNIFNSELIALIHTNIQKYKGIEYATSKMEEYHKKAITQLDTFPNNSSKEALVSILNYVLDRKN